MVVDYPGQSVGGSSGNLRPNLQMNNSWLPDMLNAVQSRQLSSTKSERWLNRLAIMEENFYGDIVQQYSASFPKAFRPTFDQKPEHLSNWGVNTNVSTTQLDWNRVYGIDIDKNELAKFTKDSEEYEAFVVNNIQEGINAANLEEIWLVKYGIEQNLKDVQEVNRDTAFSELLAEVDSHLGYIKSESFVSADEEVVILCDYATNARLRALPSLKYVDRKSRERVLEKIVPVPFMPQVFVTVNPVAVTQVMLDDNVLIGNYKLGDIIPVGSLIIDTTHFSASDYKPILETASGKTPNLLVYDKRMILVNKRPTLFNWTNIEGDIDFNFQDFQRGLVGQHTLNRSMNVAFCDLFRSKAFRFDY